MTAIGTLLRGPARPVTPDRVAPPDEALEPDPNAVAETDRPEPTPMPELLASEQPGAWYARPAVILPVVAAVIAGAVLLAFAESGAKGPGVGEAIVTVHGSAFVDRTDGTSETVTDTTRLHPGDRIDIRKGRASFELAAGVSFEGLARSGRSADTSLEMARVPTLRAGRLLVRSPDGSSLHAGIADVKVGAGGVARIARSYAVTLGSYRGESVLSSAGLTRRVPALRSVVAAATGEIGRIRPIDVRGDRWDQEYVGDALALDAQLAPLAKGMRTGNADPSSLIDAVRKELDRTAARSTIDRLAKGRPMRLDLGIGLAVIGSGERSTFAKRWVRGFGFHDAGASWGLVAMDVRADPSAVSSVLRGALDSKVLATADGRSFAEQAGLGGLGSIGSDAALATGGPDGTNADGTTGGTGSAAPGTDGTGGTGDTGLPGVPGATIPGQPGVTVPGVTTPGVTVPGVTVPGSGIPGVTVPGVTTPAVPAIPVIPGVTTPSIPSLPSIPVVGPVVTTVVGVLGGVLPILTTTTTRPRSASTTTTTRLLGGIIPGL